VKRNNLDNQLPEDEDLADLVKSAGIEKATPVVIVGKADTTTDQVNATRVAWTLRYAGVAQVGVLDGGFNPAERLTLGDNCVHNCHAMEDTI